MEYRRDSKLRLLKGYEIRHFSQFFPNRKISKDFHNPLKNCEVSLHLSNVIPTLKSKYTEIIKDKNIKIFQKS